MVTKTQPELSDWTEIFRLPSIYLLKLKIQYDSVFTDSTVKGKTAGLEQKSGPEPRRWTEDGNGAFNPLLVTGV